METVLRQSGDANEGATTQGSEERVSGEKEVKRCVGCGDEMGEANSQKHSPVTADDTSDTQY